jgi:hypothetical protein
VTVAVTGATGALGAVVALDGVQTLEHLTGTRPLDLAGFLAAEPSSWAHLSR